MRNHTRVRSELSSSAEEAPGLIVVLETADIDKEFSKSTWRKEWRCDDIWMRSRFEKPRLLRTTDRNASVARADVPKEHWHFLQLELTS